MEEAEQEMAKIEEAVRKSGQEIEPVDDSQALELVPEKQYGYVTFLRPRLPRRTRNGRFSARR